MSRIHVLERARVSTPEGVTMHRCIVHVPVPSGDNPAGVAWQRAMLGAGRIGVTRLREGDEPDQISSAEKTQVAAGEIVELELTLPVDAQGRVVAVRDGTFDALVADAIAEIQADLQHYGRVVA